MWGERLRGEKERERGLEERDGGEGGGGVEGLSEREPVRERHRQRQ